MGQVLVLELMSPELNILFLCWSILLSIYSALLYLGFMLFITKLYFLIWIYKKKKYFCEFSDKMSECAPGVIRKLDEVFKS